MSVRFRRELCLLAVALGCRPEPVRPVVDDIGLSGLSAIDEKPILEGLSTVETPRVFGIEGILEYATYDRYVLARDLQRIERYLRARGYYEAKVTAARVVHLEDNRVRVEIRVHEGLPVRIERVDPGIAKLPWSVMAEANRARTLSEGDVLDEQRLEADKRNIQRVLLDRGFAFAKVSVHARVDIPTRSAHVRYIIDPGKSARYGRVTFAGLEEIPEKPVRETLQIEEGQPYSESDLEDARQALVNLGVFSTIDIVADRSDPQSAIVPIQVRVRESALRTLRLGGGMRFDVLRLMSRLETSWEHRNFLGGMRTFNINARPGVTFFPTRIDRLERPTRLLPENTVSSRLRQPSFIEGRTTGTLSAEYSVAPLLYPLPDELEPEEERIIGYHEVRASAAIERWFFGHKVWIQPSYNWQGNFPFTYQVPAAADPSAGLGPEIPSRPAERVNVTLDLKPVRVSFPQLVTTLDLRDDPVRTRRGLYLSNSLQVAGHIFGGDVSDVQIRPEVRAFFPIDASVLGLRVALGFLFPSDYGESLTERDRPPSDPRVVHDQQKLNLRAFYSGGPNSNRGYPFRTVGPHGPVGFLAPSNSRGCIDWRSTDGCLRPLGGASLWEASIEARIPFPIDTPLEGVLFVDASDLTREVGRIRLNVPHLSPGAGLRYLTPIGPVRLDIGWRVPSLQAIGKDSLPETEGRPGGDLFGFFPGAVHFVFGSEAF